MPKIIEGFADRILVPDSRRDVQVFDDGLAGFGIRKFASGKAFYIVKYSVGGQQRKISLGRVVRGELASMRKLAGDALAKARLGQDIVAEKQIVQKRAQTLGELIPRYLASRQDDLRPKSFSETSRYLSKSWRPLHQLPLETITRKSIVGVIDHLETNSGKVSADRARVALSGFFGWAIDRGHADNNPTLHIRARAPGSARHRVLSETELRLIWNACRGDDDYSRIVQLLILTGQRRAEIGDLSWREIDFTQRQINLPPHRTKNGRAHLVPLSGLAISLLGTPGERDLVFGTGIRGYSGWSKAKAELDRRIAQKGEGPIEPWTLHDIRRSVVTALNERGIAQPHVIEALVNHVSGARAGVAGVYNRAAYAEEKRKSIEAWSSHLGHTLQQVCAFE